jgi:hypothetical protein
MNEELSNKLTEIKPLVRSILLSLGRRASEREFRSEFFNTEGESFNEILRNFRMTFYNFMRSIPDVCKVWKIKNCDGNEDVYIERVSSEDSSHMDKLTIVKKKKKVAASYKR